MASVRIITQPACPFCELAVDLLTKLGVEVDKTVLKTPAEKEAFKKHHETVPQIWIGKTHIGGYDHLKAFLKGKLLDAAS
ncbi:glutaredoxin domain-containing protein [Rhizobium rosettiformans]|nr:glutaredoxin domain-containing protein [Rhizobium rosettiformans]